MLPACGYELVCPLFDGAIVRPVTHDARIDDVKIEIAKSYGVEIRSREIPARLGMDSAHEAAANLPGRDAGLLLERTCLANPPIDEHRGGTPPASIDRPPFPHIAQSSCVFLPPPPPRKFLLAGALIGSSSALPADYSYGPARDISAPIDAQPPFASEESVRTSPRGQNVRMYPRRTALSPYEDQRAPRFPPRTPIGRKRAILEECRNGNAVGSGSAIRPDLLNSDRPITLSEPEGAARPLCSSTGEGLDFDERTERDGSLGAAQTPAKRTSSPGRSTHASACGPAS